MSVNLVTLNVIKRTPFAINLCDTLGGYVLNYLLSEDNTVDNITEEKTIILLKLCNLFAEMNNMQDLCDIYDVFGLEQDVMIIYYAIVQQLIEDLH
jgi:hypothetical protein